jgi:uncharacterized membrane protein
MKFLLKLKHWQLFALTYGISFLLIAIEANSGPSNNFGLALAVMTFLVTGTFGWIWAIATKLNNKLPQEIKLSKRKFNWLFIIPLLCIILTPFLTLIVLSLEFADDTASNTIDLIVGAYIGFLTLSLIIILWGISFAAKTLKSIELKRKASFSEYAGEFFLIWFSIIGYWILQPRINKLIKSE